MVDTTIDNKQDKILDGLAWAKLSEQARIARIAAKLVRDIPTGIAITKVAIKEAVSATMPPYGRGRVIFEGVTEEYQRQLPIFRKRQEAHREWKQHTDNLSNLSYRINAAYAARFDRPEYRPRQSFPEAYIPQFGDPNESNYWERRNAWDKKEDERDKGDDCDDLIIYKGHTICLVTRGNNDRNSFVAVRQKKGPITKIHLSTSPQRVELSEIAMVLGGPRVQSAITSGERVVTDWINRRSVIYHDATETHEPWVETIEWQAKVSVG